MRNSTLVPSLFLGVLLLSPQWAAVNPPHAYNKNAQQARGSRNALEVPIVSIDAEVISSSTGLVVNDLSHEDFSISENNVQQPIYVWQHLPKPLSLLIVVDAAASDPNGHRIDNQVNALKSSLARWLEPADEASVMVVGERAIVLQDYTGNEALINAALDKASQEKNTSLPVSKRLPMALEEAAKHLGDVRNPEARRVIVLIADLPQSLADKVVLRGAAVRAMIESTGILCWNRSPFPSSHFSDQGVKSLDKLRISDLVGLTGGEFVGSDWRMFLERVRKRYRIIYLPFNEGREGELVRIKLELKPNAGRDPHDMVLIYPRFAIMPSS